MNGISLYDVKSTINTKCFFFKKMFYVHCVIYTHKCEGVGWEQEEREYELMEYVKGTEELILRVSSRAKYRGKLKSKIAV